MKYVRTKVRRKMGCHKMPIDIIGMNIFIDL